MENQKIKDNLKKYIYIHIALAVLITIMCIIVFVSSKNDYSKEDMFGQFIDYNKGWRNEKNKEMSLANFNKKLGYSTDKYTVLYKKIDSKIVEGDTLCFRGLSTDIKIYIDDKLVLDTPYKEHILACDSPGSVWYFYEFKEKDLGKNLKMKIKPYYNDNSCYITDMYVGNSVQYIYNIFTDNALFFILCFLLIMEGVIFILADIFINTSQKISTHPLLYIGIYSVCLGVWSSTSTHLIEFVFNNPQMVQTLACNMLHMLAIPCILFLDILFKLKQSRPVQILCLCNIISYGIVWILQLTDIMDFHESLPIAYIELCGSLIAIFIIIMLNKKNNTEKDELSKTAKNIRNVVFVTTLICVFIDAIIYIQGTTTPGLFISFDLILVLIYLANVSINELFSSAKASNHAEFIKQLAYKDGLTNVGNRTSYTEKISELESNIKGYKTIGIVMFDINNLKTVNDTFGHIQGDDLIISASRIIHKTFSDSALIYRIGGDEFVAIIDKPNAKELFKIAIMQFNVNIHNFNMFYNKEYNLSIAYGCSFYSNERDKTLKEVIEEADSNMYIKKNEMKNKQ